MSSPATIDDTAAGAARVDAIRLRLVSPIEDRSANTQAADALSRVLAAVDALGDVELSRLDASDVREWLVGVEQVRRMVDAVGVAAAGHVDRCNPFRDQGFFTAKTAVKHMTGLSGPEAFRRVQTARMHAGLPVWADAHTDGRVGVSQCELMARVVANPRLAAAVVERDAPALLDDAIGLPFEEFERRVRTWEALADPNGDLAAHERRHAARDVTLRPRPEGGWTLTGNLPELAGAEFMEIFSWFLEAEWHTDWADARHRLGDTATTHDLARTEPQRRADALLAMARAAASTPPGSQPPRATANVLIDQDTFEARLRGETRNPADYAKVVCRTQTGRRLHPDDAVNTALIAHIRRVVYDTSGTVIDLGRRSRLFRGAARDAVMLLLTNCAWIGCDRPIDWCDADHSVGWKAHGATVPRNGSALCPRHNRLKERGFHTHRDQHGQWHITDPHGNPVN